MLSARRTQNEECRMANGNGTKSSCVFHFVYDFNFNFSFNSDCIPSYFATLKNAMRGRRSSRRKTARQVALTVVVVLVVVSDDSWNCVLVPQAT